MRDGCTTVVLENLSTPAVVGDTRGIMQDLGLRGVAIEFSGYGLGAADCTQLDSLCREPSVAGTVPGRTLYIGMEGSFEQY